jgi:hypothetical protein
MWMLVGALLLALHLLAMNFAAAGPLAAVWLKNPGRSGAAAAARVARQSLAALGAGIVLGVPLLLLPNEPLRAALNRFPASTYWFAGAELAFSAICTLLLVSVLRGPRPRPVLAWLLAAASATNLLYHFPPLMAVIGKLAGDPGWAEAAVIDHRTLLTLARRPEIVAMWMHFVLASVAVAAVAALLPGAAAGGEAPSLDAPGPLVAERGIRGLAGIALTASALQAPVGAWLLLAVGASTRDALLGGDLVASACFVGGVVAAIALLQALAAIALGDVTAARRRRTAWLLVAVAVLMSATLLFSRSDRSLQQHADRPAAAQVPQ